jgi:hypothetical protein
MEICQKLGIFLMVPAPCSAENHISQKLTQQFLKIGMQCRLSRHVLGNVIQQLIPEFISEFFKNHHTRNKLLRTFFTNIHSIF